MEQTNLCYFKLMIHTHGNRGEVSCPMLQSLCNFSKQKHFFRIWVNESESTLMYASIFQRKCHTLLLVLKRNGEHAGCKEHNLPLKGFNELFFGLLEAAWQKTPFSPAHLRTSAWLHLTQSLQPQPEPLTPALLSPPFLQVLETSCALEQGCMQDFLRSAGPAGLVGRPRRSLAQLSPTWINSFFLWASGASQTQLSINLI